MPSQKNQQLLAETKDRVNKANAVFFAEYAGITHKQLEEVRKALRTINAEVAITKNNLINIAFKDKDIDTKENLQGALAAFFSYKDPAKTANTMYQFFKKNFDPSKIKFGVFENKVIDNKTVVALATLPSKEVLLGKLVGLLKSPLNGLVYSLNYNTSKLVMTLKAIEDQKGKVS